MPLYEYRCRKCGCQFERIRKFSDPPLTLCEECGGELEMLLSPPGIQFKGSGWYVTDYARKNPSESAKGDGGSSAKSEGPAGDQKKAEPSTSAKTSESKPSKD